MLASCSHSLLSRRSQALRPPLLKLWLLMAGEAGLFSDSLGLPFSGELLMRAVRRLLSFRAVDLILYLSGERIVSVVFNVVGL